jgi:hypothetical protein
METREQRIYEEAAALWRELFDEPPPGRTDGLRLLEMITHNLEDPSYKRLRSPFLRPSTIVGPGQPKDERALRG